LGAGAAAFAATGTAAAGEGYITPGQGTEPAALTLYGTIYYTKQELSSGVYHRIREQLYRGSVQFCDATDGQVRIGKVILATAFSKTPAVRDADLVFRAPSHTAGCDQCRAKTEGTPGLGLANPSADLVAGQIGFPAPNVFGDVIAHELGHYVLGLAEQYPASTGSVAPWDPASTTLAQCLRGAMRCLRRRATASWGSRCRSAATPPAFRRRSVGRAFRMLIARTSAPASPAPCRHP
jgi:hypothetical protein